MGLTVRIIQTPQSFVGNPDWLLPDYSTPGKWGSWYALDRFSRNGVFLPRTSYGPWLDILANCQRSGAYCAKKPNDMSIDVCPQGYNLVAYDKCCNPSTCLYADGTTEPVTSPTISPTPMPTNSPTIFNKSPTYSPTPQPAECVDEPNDKFFLKTKGKNKKPVYQKCKWLAKKPAKKIKKSARKVNLTMVPDLRKKFAKNYVELVQQLRINFKHLFVVRCSISFKVDEHAYKFVCFDNCAKMF